MTERELDNRTGSILSAYRKLSGTDYIPTLAEYISLRSYAADEMRQGISGGGSAPPAGVPAREPVPQPVKDTKPAVKREPKKVQPPLPETAEDKSDEQKEENVVKPRLKGYDILKDLEDPWN